MNPKELDIRTKPIEESVFEVCEWSTASTVVDYQPGNGTRYVIQFTKLDKDMGHFYGLGRSGGWMVTYMRGGYGTTMVLSSLKGIVFPGDTYGKLTENMSDAYVLAEYIAHFCGMLFED